jgi:Patatin-like phospholipase
LKAVYTTYSTNQLVTKHPVRGLLGGDALASNAPLAGVIASYITPEFLQEVAHEHARGRRLLIGTTNLDAQRPVIWDMGRIASSGDPRALELFRNVLLASAAIPGLFPPVYIEVNAEGQLRQEMHVDGGTTNQVFLLPTQINSGGMDTKLGIRPIRRLYIVRNGRIDPEFKVVKASTLAIAGRSILTLIKTQGIGDLYQMYEFAKRNGVAYNLAYIPGISPTPAPKPSTLSTCPSCSISASSVARTATPGRRPRLGWAARRDATGAKSVEASRHRSCGPPRPGADLRRARGQRCNEARPLAALRDRAGSTLTMQQLTRPPPGTA